MDLSAPQAQRFFRKNVARWLRCRPDCMRPTQPGPNDPDWALEAVRQGRPIHCFQLSPAAIQDLELLQSWVLTLIEDQHKTGHPGAEAKRTVSGLNAMSVEHALDKATAWHKAEQMRSVSAPPRGPYGYNTNPFYIFETTGGFMWEKLPAPDVPYVGYDLLNCMRNGAYQKDVALRTISVWGLRDPQTRRFVVALTTPGQSHDVLSVRGFRNAHPLAYKQPIHELLKELGSTDTSAPDLIAIGLN